MKQTAIVCVVVAGLTLGAVPAGAQPAPTKMKSPALALAGLLTSAVGISLLIPHGETYRILDREYCVKGSYTVDAGDCAADPKYRTAGWITLAAGAGLAAVGLSRVRVSASPSGASAAYRVEW